MNTHEIIDALRQWQGIAERARAGVAPVDYVLLRNAADEIERLQDKALRFDLDQAGVERREAETVELVDLRAKVNRLAAQIEVLKLDRNMWRSMADVYLAERQEMRNLFPACLDEFGPSLLDAMKQELEARKS